MTVYGTDGASAPEKFAEGASPLPLVRVVLRPIASSGPLAFLAFGTGTILYTAMQLQWIPIAESRTLSVALLAFVVPLEIIAGLVGFAARDAGLATTVTMFGGVWATVAIGMLLSPPGARSVLVGIFLLVIATMVLLIGVGAATTRPLLFVLTVLAAARFVLSGVYELTGSTVVEHVSGWLGIPILAVALYGAVALQLEDLMRRPVLPLGRRKDAKAALEGGIGSQVDRIAHEAGVRQQL